MSEGEAELRAELARVDVMIAAMTFARGGLRMALTIMEMAKALEPLSDQGSTDRDE